LYNRFEYERAQSAEEASAKLLEGEGDGETMVIAGGTALVIMLKEKILTPKRLVDISQIADLRGVSYDDARGLSIGSMVTHLEVENSPIVARNYPSLREAFHTIGNVRVRTVGTIGGNLAYAEPQCNPPTILAALGASVHLTGPNGGRVVPAEDFIKGIFESALEPGEIIVSVTIPPPQPFSACSFFKFTQKSETDKPTSVVAVYIRSDQEKRKALEVRLVVGAVGPRTYRCSKAEDLVKRCDDLARLDRAKVAQVASEEFEVMDDLYGPAWYKKCVTDSIIRDALKATVDSLGRESA